MSVGDINGHRFRSQRRPGASALRRTITTIAEPRAASSGAAVLRRSGGQFTGAPAEIATAGDPTTGNRVAIWDHFLFDSTIDGFG